MKKFLRFFSIFLLLGTTVHSQDLLFTSEFGGANTNGAIIKYSPATGNSEVLTSLGGNPFTANNALINNDTEWNHAKGGLTLGMDGKYYGVAFLPSGIVNLSVDQKTDRGIFYRFDPVTNKTQVLHAFTGAGEYNMPDINHTAAYNEDLAGPVFRVVEASSGVFYGIAALGGTYDKGGVWKFNVNTMTYTKIGEFDDLPLGMGYNPSSNLVHGDGNNLYGVLSKRNENHPAALDNGSLYRINTVTDQLEYVHGLNSTQSLSAILSFPSGDIVYIPASHKFYGTKMSSWDNLHSKSGGGVWSYNLTTDEVHFEWAINYLETNILGSQVGGLVQANDGKIYVFSKAGGANDFGTIIKYSPIGNTYAKVLDFTGTTFPHNSGFLAVGSKIYGNWEDDPATHTYQMFSYDVLSGMLDNMIPWTTALPGNNKEVQFIVSGGKIIGRMLNGGTADAGSFFSYEIGTQVSTILAECTSLEGRGMVGELSMINDSILVGYTGMGGALPNEVGFSANKQHELGDMVKINARTGTITVLPDAFKHTYFPASYNTDQLNLKFSRPLLASDGKLYYSYIHMGYQGSFFRMSSYDMTTNTRAEITNGQNLQANQDFEAVGLTEVSPGKILTCFRDSVYQWNFNDTAYTTRKYSHDMNLYGFFKGNYTVASNGRIYGTTKMKGFDVTPPVPLGNSVIFSLDPVNFDFQVEYTFDVAIKNCNAGLTEINGILYGSTNYGGTNNNGYLFSFGINAKTMVVEHNFDRMVDGAGFEGEWTVLNGKLYSTSYTGGANGYGTLAEYDPLTSTFTVLKHLTMADGRSFRGTPLVYTHGVPVNSEVSGKISQGQSLCAGAWQTITVAGGGTTFQVCCGGFANMVAGKNILYLPGTWIKHGGNMHGYIDAGEPFCGIQTPSLPSTVSGEDQPVDDQPVAVLQNRNFTIYPNPASESFTFEQTGEKTSGEIDVNIFSMRGEQMMTKHLYGEKKYVFSVSDLQNGLYFVKIVKDGAVETLKLVITR